MRSVISGLDGLDSSCENLSIFEFELVRSDFVKVLDICGDWRNPYLTFEFEGFVIDSTTFAPDNGDTSGTSAGCKSALEFEFVRLAFDKDVGNFGAGAKPCLRFPDADFDKVPTTLTNAPDDGDASTADIRFVKLAFEEDVGNFGAGPKPCLKFPDADFDNESTELSNAPDNWDESTAKESILGIEFVRLALEEDVGSLGA